MYPQEIPAQFRSSVSDDGTRISLANCELAALPDWLEGMTALASVDLGGNRLTALPEWIGSLTALTRIDLGGNQLSTLPESLGNLTALTRLDLGGNQLAALPEWLGNLTATAHLDLNGNQLTALPESLGALTALTALYLNGNQLTALPESLGNLTALTGLYLDGNRLRELPDSIGSLTALTMLYLGRNRLRELPGSLGSLTGLTTLYLDRNQLGALPDSLGNLTALTSLYVGRNQLTTLPGSLGRLAALISLDLGGNQLTHLPESLGSLTALTSLDLGGNQLRELPDSVGSLTALNSLNLSRNLLAALPDSLGRVTTLATLDLAGNQLTDLPESLGNLTALTRLDLGGNQLTDLPESLGNLTALTTLYLGGNQLIDLPGSLGNLTALTRLDLGGNQLTDLPDSLGNLTALTGFNLGRNRLTDLPESLGSLTALTSLDLGGNTLAALPEWLGSLTALTGLYLDGNELTGLPESLGRLTALTGLYLDGNKLVALPDSIGSLNALTSLYLSGNQLAALPDSLGGLTALTSLYLGSNQLRAVPRLLADRLTNGLLLKLDDNPLDDPLPELVRRGADALAAYLGSLDETATLYEAKGQYEAKLLLVGEGNVGKTSLIAALRDAPFVEGRPTTHGIEVSPLMFRHPYLDLDMTLRAWDFGGQHVYRVTHQFFFSRRALYVVVWKARDGQEQDQVESWLRRIRLRAGPDAITIVVATHCAERSPELDYPQLKLSFPDMLVGSFEVDSRTELGLRELREAIGRQAAQLPQMGQLISIRWVAARDEILARAHAEPQIPYEQFAEVCERHGVVGTEVVTLAELMHDLGQVIYYGEDEGLRDIVVLDPEWLTKAISYLLEDRPTRNSGGVLDHARLRDIWQGRDNGQTYPTHYHPYFLRLMEKFDISYRLDGDELHSLVAQLVPHERPTLPWQPRMPVPPGFRVLALVCRLAEPAPGLIPWLTVRHHRSSTGLHWRRGVFLRHPIAAYASEALLELRPSGELAVEVRAPSPDLFFNVLRDSIEDLITRRWPGLDYQLLIPCPGRKTSGAPMCPGEFPLNKLLQMRERGRTSVPCWECTDDYQISVLLTGFTGPGKSLGAELDQMHDQLARIETGIIRIEGQEAKIAESVRRVLRVVSAEVTDCPRLFTVAPRRPAGGRRVRFFEHHYRLTLWCEHPGYWHPWVQASYELDPPRDWFTQISPYATLIFRTLQLVVPAAGSIADVMLSPAQLARAQDYLQLMGTLVAELPGTPGEDLGRVGLGEATGQLTAAEGQALRALRAILFERDRRRTFGGMRRVQAPSGDFLWVCTDHYPEYDPGLPTVP